MRIQVNARNQGFEFEARGRESVLYAGLRAGVDLPYECATGTCGTCKAKLISGRLRDGWREAPGRKYVKPEQAEFLMCQCAAETDVTLQVSKFINAADPGACAPVACQGVLRGARLLTHDVMAFGIELERACDFEAGQFMVLAAPGVAGYRGYSMINFERSARRVDFVVKKKPGGAFSEWLFSAPREGATLSVFGPLGKATFYPALASNLLCIAGGSGIAGMMSILARAAQERHFERYRGWVFFGVRTMRDAFFLQELSTHAAKVKVTIALSDEPVPETARRDWPALAFAHGLVHEVARNKYENVRAYVAGPPPAVDAALRMLLLEAKLTSDNIRYDKYS